MLTWTQEILEFTITEVLWTHRSYPPASRCHKNKSLSTVSRAVQHLKRIPHSKKQETNKQQQQKSKPKQKNPKKTLKKTHTQNQTHQTNPKAFNEKTCTGSIFIA